MMYVVAQTSEGMGTNRSSYISKAVFGMENFQKYLMLQLCNPDDESVVNEDLTEKEEDLD